MTLLNTLATLNSDRTSLAVWVNRNDYDDHFINKNVNKLNDENYSNYVNIGPLDWLSFGNQSVYHALVSIVKNESSDLYKLGINVKEYFSQEAFILGLYNDYVTDKLPVNTKNYLDCRIKETMLKWSYEEAKQFIDTRLPALLAS